VSRETSDEIRPSTGSGRPEPVEGRFTRCPSRLAGSRRQLSKSRLEVPRRFLAKKTPGPLIPTFVSQDFPFGLKPVIQGALADALLVDLVRTLGDPFVKLFGRRRCSRTFCSAARRSPACRLRFVGFHVSHLMAVTLNQVSDARLCRVGEGVKGSVGGRAGAPVRWPPSLATRIS